MDALPDTLIVRASKAIRAIERLCSHQDLNGSGVNYFDRIFASVVEMMERPNLTGRNMDDAVGYILVTHRLDSLNFDAEEVDSFRNGLLAALIHLRIVLDDLNPYVHGRLMYRYRERRGQQSVILQLHNERSAQDARVLSDTYRRPALL